MTTLTIPTLLPLSERDAWTTADAYEGTIVFGGNGSGKTTGSGKDIARAFLGSGFGGLVLTVKVDEASRWHRYLHEAGRSADLIEVRPGGAGRLNFLEYEAGREGLGAGLTYELVRILQTAMEGGRERGRSENPYWDDAVAQLLTNAIDLVLLANGSATLPEIMDVVRSAPLSPADAATLGYDGPRREALRCERSSIWAEDSRCAELLTRAWQVTRGTAKADDFRETYEFFVREWAPLDDRTRSNVLSTLMARLTGLLRSPFRQLFCGSTTVTPNDTFAGKVIVLNLPVKEYGEVGRFAQILFKTVWQRAVERRGSHGRPVFLWADEAQFFVTKYDMLFQQTARSSRAAAVYLTQSVVNFRAALDAGDASNISDSLLGNLQTKIFHANACPLTNEYAERLFGSELQATANMSVGSGGVTGGYQRSMLPILPALKFTTLKKGGATNAKVVEGYVFQAGKVWNGNDGKHRKNWMLVPFKQDA
jgi:hypothetical protein